MPALFGRHLIDKFVFLSLNEVADNLPELAEEIVPVPLDYETEVAYREIENALKDAIRDMIRRGDRRLLGAMLRTLLGYPDHPYGYGEIGYQDMTLDGQPKWVSVVTPQQLSETTVRPKEQALIDHVAAEVDAGRQCLGVHDHDQQARRGGAAGEVDEYQRLPLQRAAVFRAHARTVKHGLNSMVLMPR